MLTTPFSNNTLREIAFVGFGSLPSFRTGILFHSRSSNHTTHTCDDIHTHLIFQGNALGDFYFRTRSVLSPIECREDPRSHDCYNPEVTSEDLTVTKVQV